ncbi:hypothetical protein THRCLA_10861, partial [Thraustotheca clavata]
SGGRYSVAADIYSFGVVLSEFDSHEIPYNDLRDPSDGRRLGNLAIMARVREGTLRPIFSSSCPKIIFNIAQQCLAADPEDRPTSYQLSAMLQSFYNSYQTGLRLVKPPCLVGNKTTTELSEITFATFCLPTTAPPIAHLTTLPVSTQVPTPSSTNYTAIIAGCVAGGAVLAALIVWVIMRCKKQRNIGTRSLTAPLNDGEGHVEFDFSVIQKYKISLDDLEMQRVIGSGAYAEVRRGIFHGKPVAIKKLLPDQATNQGIQDFIDEIKLIIRFDSPYIIKTIGTAWTSPSNLLCVMEYMDM